MNKNHVQILFLADAETKRLLDWIAEEKVKRDGLKLGRLRGYRSQVLRDLIRLEAARMRDE